MVERREFLKFLAASPLLAGAPAVLQLRARRFVDVSGIDLSTTLFGQTLASPRRAGP